MRNQELQFIVEKYNVSEGAISDLYIDAHQAKNFDEFYKKLVSDMKAKHKEFSADKEFQSWANWIYTEAKKVMDEKPKKTKRISSLDEFIKESMETS